MADGCVGEGTSYAAENRGQMKKRGGQTCCSDLRVWVHWVRASQEWGGCSELAGGGWDALGRLPVCLELRMDHTFPLTKSTPEPSPR